MEMIIAPNIQAMLSGAYMAQFDGRKVTLTYTDETQETATIPDSYPIDKENWFSIVGAVQSLRKPA